MTQTLGSPADPSDAVARGLLALKQNRFEAALEAFTAAEREQPSSARIRNFRGIALAALGRSSQAEAEYREAIRLDPRQPEPYRNLGYLAWTTHHPAQAEQALHTALSLAPDDHFARYYLGRVELEEHQNAAAVNDLERTRELWPSDPEFLLALASAELSLHRDAHAALDRSGQLPLSRTQMVTYGSLLIASGLTHPSRPQPDPELERGVGVFRRLAAHYPHAWAQFDLALALVSTRRPAEAVPIAARLARSEPSAPAWALLGIAEARSGDPERAIAALREAARLAPTDEDRWLDLTQELMAQANYAGALEAVQQGLASNPQSYALRLRLGAVYLRSGRYREAEEVFRDLIARGEPIATPYLGLAQALLHTGRAAEAVDLLRQARARLGQNMLLVYFLGIALDREGKPEEAEQAFREAARLDPARPEIHLALGKSELKLHRSELAVAELTETLRLDPHNAQAKRLLAQALNMQKDPVQAAHYAHEAESDAVLHPDELPEDDFILPPWQYPSPR
jgi:Flp pilus assembly protein TadD